MGKNKGASKGPKKEYSNEWIKYTFTEEEVKDMAHAMAGDIQQMEDLESELTKIKAEITGRTKALAVSIKETSRKVHDGFEQRHTRVRVLKNFDDKTVYFYIEKEDGSLEREPAKTRTMFQSELQMTINDVGAQKGGGAE